jgi:phenylacetate-CoA ligase
MRGLSAIEGAERLDAADLARIQAERWKGQAAYVAAGSDFYRSLKLTGRIEELADLPFTDKDALRADQQRHPPFGSYLASAPEKVARVHRTSGSTGSAMNIALSAQDCIIWAKVGARAMRLSGLGPGHRVVHCLNYQMWMGGYTDHAVLEASGATVIPFGVGGSEKLIGVIRDLAVTAIHCTPSYPAVLERIIAEHYPGLKPRDLGLKLGLFGGEAGLDQPAFRARLEQTWGFAVRNANYGVSDVLTIMAGQSESDDDLHYVASDVLHAGLIDPDTAQAKPWREGESGELVLTHLARECQPLVRFRTGDVVTLTGTGPTAAGVTAPRFRVVGRADDMVVVRGLNMFPAMVQGVVGRFAELSGEYRIVLDAPPPYDALPIEVELAEGAAPDGLASAVEAAIKHDLGGTARVKLLPPLALPRSEGKTRRVLRTY